MSSAFRLDTQLRPSRYRLMLWFGMIGCLTIMITLMPLLLAYRIMVLILLGVSFWFAQVSRRHLVAISTLINNRQPFQTSSKLAFLDWQLQWRQGYIQPSYQLSADIYQAKLIKVTNLGRLLILEFWITQPIEQRLKFEIWQDQVDKDTWQQLKILTY